MKIAVIGDLHIPSLQGARRFTGKDRHSFYKAFMEHFFSIPADLYVWIGKLTNSGSTDELEKVYATIREHRKPFVHVGGNLGPDAIKRQEVLKITRQERFHSMSTEHAVLAFLDTAQDHEECDGAVDPVQQQWLETVIEESGNRPLLVFGQHPVQTAAKPSIIGNRCVPPIIPMWELLSKKQGAGLYITGHNRFYSIAAREQWTFLQIAAVLDEQAVRIIEVSDSLITIDYASFIIPSMKEDARKFGKTLDHFKWNPYPLGTEPDVKYTIPLPAFTPIASKVHNREAEKIKSL